MTERSALSPKLVLLVLVLFGFFLGLDLMGLAFKLFGRGFAEALIARTANPFVGLLVGILATTLVQSSSTTTSMTVGLVAAGALTIDGAIPIIMGANVGTSVTNTIVSLGAISRRLEFQRAFAGATLHDFFNLMSVLILLPLEIATGALGRAARAMARLLEGVGGGHLLDPLKLVVRPVAEWLSALTGDSGVLVLLMGVGLLFLSLKLLVDLLNVLMSERAEQILHRTLFRSATAAVVAGVVMTTMAQSSSVTTSVMVPLVGAGIVTLEQLFPFMIGANLGTTLTAMLAALATGTTPAIAVAFSHLLFNLAGALVIYVIPPMRAIPLALARWMGGVAARSRTLALTYVGTLFYLVPILLLLWSGTISLERGGAGPEAVPPDRPVEPQAAGTGVTPPG